MSEGPEWTTDPVVLANDRQRGHSLWPTAEELAEIPRIYATETVDTRRKVVRLHYFMGSADWWIVEVDPVDGLAFGFACLGDPEMAEWGYVSIGELAGLLAPVRFQRVEPDDINPQTWKVKESAVLHQCVERDLHWKPDHVENIERLAAFRRAIQ